MGRIGAIAVGVWLIVYGVVALVGVVQGPLILGVSAVIVGIVALTGR